MRTILFGLLLLAGTKIWFQEHTYRAAMADAVIDAYRQRAIEVCRRNVLTRANSFRSEEADAWGPASHVEAVIGNPDVSVAIWDTQNPLWVQRFRDPHLVLTSSGADGARCAYDVRDGGATVTALAP